MSENNFFVALPSDPRYRVAHDGRVVGARGRLLRPDTVKGGYQRVKVAGKHALVHRLVVETHRGPIPEGMQVNHIDGDTSNNCLSNLEVVTPSENVRHSIDVLHTERAPGKKNCNAKVTDDDVIQIRQMYRDGVKTGAIARAFGITPGNTWRIATRRAWRHV